MSVLLGVRKIAVLRVLGIGDFFVALPALTALRAAYPRAEIVLLGRSWQRDLLAGRAGPIDRVEVVPTAPGVGAPNDAAPSADLPAFLDRLREEHFDIAIQMQGGGAYSNEFVHALRPRTSVGMRTPDARPLDQTITYNYFQHEVVRYLDLVRLVGATALPQQPRFSVTAADRAESEAAYPPTKSPFVCLNAGATDTRRRWPAENFGAIAERLADAGAEVVVTGGPEDTALAEKVSAATNRPHRNLAGRLSLGALAGLYARAAMLVSNDSGPLHLAQAVGTPTVGLFWAPAYSCFGPLSRIRDRVHIAWRTTCPRCDKPPKSDEHYFNGWVRDCAHEDSWITEIPIGQVWESIVDLQRDTATTR